MTREEVWLRTVLATLQEQSTAPRVVDSALYRAQCVLVEYDRLFKPTPPTPLPDVGTFEWAIEQLRAGRRVRRAGWSTPFLEVVLNDDGSLRAGTPFTIHDIKETDWELVP